MSTQIPSALEPEQLPHEPPPDARAGADDGAKKASHLKSDAHDPAESQQLIDFSDNETSKTTKVTDTPTSKDPSTQAKYAGVGLQEDTRPTSGEGPISQQWGSQEQHSTQLHNEESKDDAYLDPTPKTPRQGVSPTRESRENEDEDADVDGDSTSEIQSIMEQFDLESREALDETPMQEKDQGQGLNIMNVSHPPRGSSLEPLRNVAAKESVAKFEQEVQGEVTAPPKSQEYIPPGRVSSLPHISKIAPSEDRTLASPHPSLPPARDPPAPDPEPDLPFDFHRFLDQLRHRTADPVAKYLRSFLIEFGRKQWMVHEQVKLISDFLAFITNKMARCEVWKGVSDAEFDNAKEGMEKLVMNRLYTQTFSPAIPPPPPSQSSKGKRKVNDRPIETGRRGQHQEDIERDDILGQKIRIYGWVEEDHLDIPRVSENGRRLLSLAQQELLKIKTYRAPRDKIICVLNCCKVIFGILKNSRTSDTSADSFVPLLIYVVLHANPEHLVSNVQYILRFRNQDKLNGEAGYYLSSLMGAIQFIENLDRTTLTVSDEDFEKNVEASVSMIAERHQEPPRQPRLPPRPTTAGHISEKSSLSHPEVVPRNSIEAEYSSPWRLASTKGHSDESTSKSEDNTAVSGLLRTIQKPLSGIGRIFADESEEPSRLPPASHSQRLSPAVFRPPHEPGGMPTSNASQMDGSAPLAKSARTDITRMLSAEDAAARQASAEAAEAQRIQRVEHQNVVE